STPKARGGEKMKGGKAKDGCDDNRSEGDAEQPHVFSKHQPDQRTHFSPQRTIIRQLAGDLRTTCMMMHACMHAGLQDAAQCDPSAQTGRVPTRSDQAESRLEAVEIAMAGRVGAVIGCRLNIGRTGRRLGAPLARSASCPTSRR